jgi:WD40 repeat protein
MQTEYSGCVTSSGVSSTQLHDGRFIVYCTTESIITIAQVTGSGIQDQQQSIEIPGHISALSLSSSGILAVVGLPSSLHLYARLHSYNSSRRNWDLVKTISLETPVSVCTWSSKGHLLAAGRDLTIYEYSSEPPDLVKRFSIPYFYLLTIVCLEIFTGPNSLLIRNCFVLFPIPIGSSRSGFLLKRVFIKLVIVHRFTQPEQKLELYLFETSSTCCRL